MTMKLMRTCVSIVLLTLSAALPAFPQQSGSAPAAAMPRLITFSGVVKAANGQTPNGIEGITFALYSEQEGSAPLWIETQNVRLDSAGRYTVQLGAIDPKGLPLELFASGEARWLGVTLEGRVEQPRVLLLSVPYALKAADAETVGGLPASAFVLAAPPSAAGDSGRPGASVSPATAALAAAASVTGTGAANTIPLWTSASNLGNSNITQSSGIVSVADTLQLPSTGTATATGGTNSQPLDLLASSFSSSSKAAVSQHFRWQAQAVGNDTASPSGSLNLLYKSGSGTPAQTGLSIASNGVITFAAVQTFPGTVGTVKSVGLAAPTTDFTVSSSPVTTTGTLNFAWKVAPTNLDTPSAIVKRDASGNFSAGAITATSVNAGTLSGNGTAITNVNAASLGGVAAGDYANLALADTFTQPLTVKTAASTSPAFAVQGTGTGAGGFSVDGFGDLTITPGTGTGAKAVNLVTGYSVTSSTGAWSGFSAINLVPGSALYPISSTQAVFYLGFVGGTTVDVGNMALYTTARGSLKVTAVTPVKLKGVSNPTIALTNKSTCPLQPVSTTAVCLVRLDPVAITLSAEADYYLVTYFTSNSNNSAVNAANALGPIPSLAGSFDSVDDTHLAVGQSIPVAATGVPNFLMQVMSN
jgi:hypothetical protein